MNDSFERAVLGLSAFGCAICLAFYGMSAPAGWFQGIHIVWWCTGVAAAVIGIAAERWDWRLLCFAFAAGLLPHPDEHGHLVRCLVVVAGSRVASGWPSRRPSLVLDCMVLWPGVALSLRAGDFCSAWTIDAATLSLFLAAAAVAFGRAVDAHNRSERLYIAGLFASISMAGACAFFVPPKAWSIAIVFTPIYLLLAVPAWRVARSKPRRLVVAAALSVLLIVGLHITH